MQNKNPWWLIFCSFTACASTSKSSDSAIEQSQPESETSALSDREVLIETSMGDFIFALELEAAPISAENFLRYVDDGFYDGSDGLGATIFHRVIADFVAQGGGYTLGPEPSGSNWIEKDTHPPIVNEASSSGLSNLRGTVAMARTPDPNSATSQFYVNVVDNVFLDPGQSSEAGYAVFATVSSGMDIIDAMALVATDSSDAPLDLITIEAVSRISD